MIITPRQYQIEAVDALWSYFNKNAKGNPLIAMPTATGKAVVIAMILERIFKTYSGQRVLVLTHVKELVQQNYDKLMTLWPQAPAGINSEGLKRRDLNTAILFAGIASLINQVHLLGPVNLAIVDEAHLISPNDKSMYRRLFVHLKEVNPYFRIVGLSATCFRLGQGMLVEGDDPIFTDICFDVTTMDAFNRFIEEGFLSPLIPKKTQVVIDLDGVHIQAGEFNSKELQVAVDKDAITEAALRESLEKASDRAHWLIFSSGLHHGQRISEMLEWMGVSNVFIHSKLKDTERDERIKAFKEGKVRAAVNYGVLTTGFDYPEIDCIIMLRPTASPVLWVQMLGRGTRVVYADGFDIETIEGRLDAIQHGPKQNCLVLDFAGNTKRLGPINDPNVPKKRGKGGGLAPVKLCTTCETYNHASVRFCICCGAEFTFEVKITGEASTDELIRQEFPIVETFDITHVAYSKHEKIGKPPMIRVTYYTFAHAYSEYLCFEHTGFARLKAQGWWKDRAIGACPATTNEALDSIELARTPTQMRVWVNKKMPQIMNFCFDGTAFGTKEDNNQRPATELKLGYKRTSLGPALANAVAESIEEDGIPF